jgi:YD repeat-containing protein
MRTPRTATHRAEGPDTTQSAETLSHAYSYDNLGRLTRSEASDGETNTYGYDPAGNRTSWDVTGSPAGDSQLTAQFNAAGQLTGTTTTGANAGTATYSFDGAGNRSSQTVNVSRRRSVMMRRGGWCRRRRMVGRRRTRMTGWIVGRR